MVIKPTVKGLVKITTDKSASDDAKASDVKVEAFRVGKDH